MNRASPLPQRRPCVVAAAHVASPMLDARRGVAKACAWIADAAARGADIVVFPESFIPGFPLWNAYLAPTEAHAWFARMADNALTSDGREIASIADAAARHRIAVCLGFTEVASYSAGCLWNANVVIGPDGRILNLHRKLVPTFYEKLTWTWGDGAGLRVVDAGVGRVGTLICGENGNPLARYALMAQGEEIHLSNYPPVWPFRAPSADAPVYDLADAIRVRAAAHAFEGKCFNVVAAGFLDEEGLELLAGDDTGARTLLTASPRSVSMVVGPTGSLLGEMHSGSEDLVLAEIDLRDIVELKQHHDIAGYYNRFDVFDLRVNRRRLGPISLLHDESAGASRGKTCAEPERQQQAVDALE